MAVAAHEGDSLGLGIVMEFLLTFARRRLDGQARATAGRDRRRPRRRRSLTAWSCGACEAETRRAAAYLEILTQASNDEMRSAIEDPDRALCLVHLSAALGRTADERDASLLVRVARRRAEKLHGRVAASLGAHASTVGRRVGDDAVLWREAPDWLAGAPRQIPPRDPERAPR
ncbi:MAG: hypothetical protein ACRDZ9_01245 [Acidimicrobiales bacterium]